MKFVHEAIILIGYKFDDHWQLPDYLREGIRKTAKMYEQGLAPKIIVCGKWSLWYDENHITPPVTESAIMKESLVKLGVPEKDIYQENHSRDTIGNAYFSKTHVVVPHHFRNLLIVCAQFHLPRVQYIFNKIYGPSYKLTYNMVLTAQDTQRDKKQEELLKFVKIFLSPMKDGQDSFLKNKLYRDHFYQKK